MTEYKNPFIKVEWEDTPENFTQERLKRVKEYFQKKYNAKDVKIVPKTLSNNLNTKLKSLEVSDNILDYQYQKKLVRDFIKDNDIKIKWELIDRLDNTVNNEIDKLNQQNIRYNKWIVKKIEFSNFLSFGEDNVIDFEDLNGITLIESNPKNFGGKTTISVSLLMFLFFNKTDKTKTNAEVFNVYTDKNDVKVKGYIEIDGEDYIIERTVNRKMSKSGEFNVKSELNFYKKIGDELVNLSGEQRRETENIITSAIGTEDDFLLTILSTGNNLEDLIESKPTARGQILTRFLGLEALKQKEEVSKSKFNEWSKTLVSNTYNKVSLENDNVSYKSNIEQYTRDISELTIKLTETENGLKKLEDDRDKLLENRNNDIDKDLLTVNVDALNIEITKLKSEQEVIKLQISSIELIEPTQYYIEEEHDKIKNKLNENNINRSHKKMDIDAKKSLIKSLEESNVCPTCKQSLKDVDHTEEINLIKNDIELKTKLLVDLENEYNELVKNADEFDKLKKEYDTYEKDKLRKSKYELDEQQKQLNIDSKVLKIEVFNKNKKKLEENQKIDNELTILRTKIETEKGNIRIINGDIDKKNNDITNLNTKITNNIELINKISLEEEYSTTFKVYLSIFGKNGISKVIIKNMIPLLNNELHRLMQDSCYFTLEFNINDKNELEFLMVDNETRVVKLLSTGSGYEKTISALAIRSVLTKISSLPKPNIVVMDEVLSKVADENLEMIGEFFKKVKEYFEHIFIISHNSLIRNWSDNLIMIKKEDNISSIDYITKKS